MSKIETISLDRYQNNFEVPYVEDFVNAFREHIIETGDKNQFILEMPLHLPGEKSPLLLHFQRIEIDTYECSENGVLVKKLRSFLNAPLYQERLNDFFSYNNVELKNNRLVCTIDTTESCARIFWNYIMALVQLNAFDMLWRNQDE